MKYLVIGLVDAVVNEVVEADSPEEALNKGHQGAPPTVCHQCSDKLEVGDFIGWRVVEDEGSGDEVYDDTKVTPTMAPRPVDLHGIVARHDRLGPVSKSRGVTQAVRDRAELIDWLRRSGVLPKEGA